MWATTHGPAELNSKTPDDKSPVSAEYLRNDSAMSGNGALVGASPSALPWSRETWVAGRMDTMSDIKLGFAALLRQHQNQLFGYIYSLVRDLDDADDLFQQTSLVLWDKFDLFDPSRSFV